MRKVKVKSHERDGSKVSAHTRKINSKPASSGSKPPMMDMGKRSQEKGKNYPSFQERINYLKKLKIKNKSRFVKRKLEDKISYYEQFKNLENNSKYQFPFDKNKIHNQLEEIKNQEQIINNLPKLVQLGSKYKNKLISINKIDFDPKTNEWILIDESNKKYFLDIFDLEQLSKLSNKKSKGNLILGKYPKKIKDEFSTYQLGLITKDYVFYYIPEEGEAVKMYDRDMNLISDNYFGFEEFNTQLAKNYKNKTWVWIDSNAQYGAKFVYQEYKEEGLL